MQYTNRKMGTSIQLKKMSQPEHTQATSTQTKKQNYQHSSSFPQSPQGNHHLNLYN